MDHETSVQNAENRPWIRKSASAWIMKLPSKMPKTGPWYGSPQGYRARNFRPKCRKQASGTEVSKHMDHETSVQNAENGPSGRKSRSRQVSSLLLVRPARRSGRQGSPTCCAGAGASLTAVFRVLLSAYTRIRTRVGWAASSHPTGTYAQQNRHHEGACFAMVRPARIELAAFSFGVRHSIH